jgi:hypothetical protein
MSVESLREKPFFDRLLLFCSRWSPKLDRVLVIESGARTASERFLARLYKQEPARKVDLLTCYDSPPAAFDSARGQVFYTHKARGKRARLELFRTFRDSGYSAICMLCTGDDIMTKWKWAMVVRLPAKVMIVNESADTFWLDRGHLRQLRGMAHDRIGSAWLIPFRIAGQAFALPFTICILVTFAAVVHGRRLWRLRHG